MQTMPHSPQLVKSLVELVTTQREAFGQERVYLRGLALLLAELTAFNTHYVTDLLRALGLDKEDWTAWYRMFQKRSRFNPSVGFKKLFTQILAQVAPDDPLVVGGDITTVPRNSKSMEGVWWGKCPRTPPFRIGIHLVQRFFNGCWLAPLQDGYSRAIPIQFFPAFPQKAATSLHPEVKEQAAGVAFLKDVRARLDAAGRNEQPVLGLFDGSYDKPDFWKNLPPLTSALVRTAKNRALKQFPPAREPNAKGRPPLYGDPAPAPQDYLAIQEGWTSTTVRVRGHDRTMIYRVEGPFLRQTMPSVPLFLICVRGQSWEKNGKQKRRDPVFYVINALKVNDQWTLPFPVEKLLAWAWQRWELEVVHREMKSVMGMGDKQAFHPQAAVSSVQWAAWVYANLMLTGYLAYGAAEKPARPEAWRRHPRRWTVTTLLNQCRAELLTDPAFRATYGRTPHNWLEIEAFLQTLAHPSTQPSFF